MSGLECNKKKGYHYWWDNVPGGGEGGGDGDGGGDGCCGGVTKGKREVE